MSYRCIIPMKLHIIVTTVLTFKVHSLCVDTQQRGAQGWKSLGVLTVDECRGECGNLNYNRVALECPREGISEKGRSECWCLNSLDTSYTIPEENCHGDSSASPSLGKGRQYHCNGPYTDSYGRNLGGWHRGAVYFAEGHDLCVDTRQRGAQGWRHMGVQTVDECCRICNEYGYDKFSMECPRTGVDNKSECFCLNYMSFEYNIADENCYGQAHVTPELGSGKNHHCTGPYTDNQGRSLGGWHRCAVYKTKQC